MKHAEESLAHAEEASRLSKGKQLNRKVQPTLSEWLSDAGVPFLNAAAGWNNLPWLACQIPTPAAVCGDLSMLFDKRRFAQHTQHDTSIVQPHLPDA